MGTSAENKDVVRRLFEAMNRADLAALDDLLADDVVRHCQATPDVEVRSLEQFKAFMAGFTTAFPDFRQTIRHLVAEDDLVAVWATASGTQTGPMGPLPASGRKAEFDFGMVARLARGRVTEWWVTWDNMTVMNQLMPPPG